MQKSIFILAGVLVAFGFGYGVAKVAQRTSLGTPTELVYSGATSSVVMVTSSDSVVLAANPARRYASLQNVNGTTYIYCSLGGYPTDGAGIVLAPSSTVPYVIDVLGGVNPWVGPVLCEHAGAAQMSVTPTIAVVQY